MRKPEAPVNDGGNYKMTVVVKKFDYMLENPSIFRYLVVKPLSDNLEVRTISRKDSKENPQRLIRRTIPSPMVWMIESDLIGDYEAAPILTS